MASIVVNLPSPLFLNGRQQPYQKTLPNFPPSAPLERKSNFSLVTKATSDSSESSASLSIAKSLQSVWDKPEDRLALIGLGFAAVVALWASSNLVTAIDKLPIIPSTFEFIGILYSSVSILVISRLVNMQSENNHFLPFLPNFYFMLFVVAIRPLLYTYMSINLRFNCFSGSHTAISYSDLTGKSWWENLTSRYRISWGSDLRADRRSLRAVEYLIFLFLFLKNCCNVIWHAHNDQ